MATSATPKEETGAQVRRSIFVQRELDEAAAKKAERRKRRWEKFNKFLKIFTLIVLVLFALRVIFPANHQQGGLADAISQRAQLMLATPAPTPTPIPAVVESPQTKEETAPTVAVEDSVPPGYTRISRGTTEKREKVGSTEFYPELHSPLIKGEGVKSVYLAIDHRGNTLAGDGHIMPTYLAKLGEWRWVEIQQTLSSGENVWRSTAALDPDKGDPKAAAELARHKSRYRPR